MQVVNNILAVALEKPYTSGDPQALFLFYDISDPENPVFKSRFAPVEPDVKAGSAGITPLANGHYLLAVTGGHNEKVWFYESLSSDPNNPDGPTELSSTSLSWVLKDIWQPDADPEDGNYLEQDWPNDPAHQTLQFLRQGDINGPLFLAGARGRIADPTANDIMDLYRVDFIGDQIRLKRISTQFMDSHPHLDSFLATPGNNVANFAAGSTFYVSPSGELIFYATEHENDGPGPLIAVVNGVPIYNKSIKVGEWRHIDMVRPDSPTLSPSVQLFGPFEVREGESIFLTGLARGPITKAWIQLFSSANFGSVRYLVVDFPDWNKDDFDDFKDLDGSLVDIHRGFNDETSSWRWFAPEGCTIRANDDDFGDDDFPGEFTKTLVGTGQPERDANLSNVPNDSNSGNVNDELTSVQFMPNCATYYSTTPDLLWDLNRNGAFETSGLVVTFSAVGLDGPSDVPVPVQALHPIDERAGYATATVHVVNVAPTITQTGVFNSLGQQLGVDVPFTLVGLPVTLRGSFTDPGWPDRQTAAINWGDGVLDPSSSFEVFYDAFGGVVGVLSHSHRYFTSGVHGIRLSVTDDDGGTAGAQTLVHVLTPEQAVEEIITLLDAAIGTTNDAGVLRALERARKALAGNPGANNGALNKLADGNEQAAIAMLRQAIDWLRRAQQAGANVATLITLLEQVIASLQA
jgi:hypothetical protein